MIKRLAIIPARGGSKRIKDKNLKLFYRKPLIYYSISAARNSKIFNKIHISSDSEKILKYSNKLKIKTDFQRPSYLADDKVGLRKVLEYVVSRYEKINESFDEIWLLYATNPFITDKIIIECSETYKRVPKKPNNALMTVTKYNYPLHWAQKLNKSNILKPLNKQKTKKKFQSFSKILCDAGMINIYKSKNFKSNFKTNYFAHEIPYHSSVDIDNNDDFEFAKKLFK